jgi:diaminopimelate epimerase
MGLHFVKHTSFGNNFVIIDETQHQVLPEEFKGKFAYQATNQSFGIGCDNFLVIQSCTPQVLDDINAHHHYWSKRPSASGATFVFRMFEPDGTEAFSCGNGLMCVAQYLFEQYGIHSTRIMTEVPTAEPKVVSIGTKNDECTCWANLGQPRRVAPDQAALAFRIRFDEKMDLIEDVEVTNFRKSDSAQFFDNQTSLSITGYLVSTGEPHLVIFTDTGFSVPGLSSLIFPDGASSNAQSTGVEKRRSSSSAFIDFIGQYFARVHKKLFPAGININFVRYVESENVLEYRCFERGINRETLACGTGALATAFVAERLDIVQGNTIRVRPHRCRWHEEDAEIQIEKSAEGWVLHGRPIMLCEGTFNSRRFLPARAMPYPHYQSSDHNAPQTCDWAALCQPNPSIAEGRAVVPQQVSNY